MKPEEVFGMNAGKVWLVLDGNRDKPLSVQQIMKISKLKKDEVLTGLGWLGREGKIEIVENKGQLNFRLV